MMNARDAMNKFASIFGREPGTIISLTGNSSEAFANYTVALRVVKEKGFYAGPMARNEPIALVNEATFIAKWHNISADELNFIDGILLSDDFRNGDVFICLKD